MASAAVTDCVHALVTRCSWNRAGEWPPVPFIDGEAAALVLRHRVFTLLCGEGLLSEERARLLLSWRHSGFCVHTSVTVPPDDRDGLERLHVDEQAQRIAFSARARPQSTAALGAPIDPKDVLARLVMHIPEPRRHVIRYYGAYSSVVRARRRREPSPATAAERAGAPTVSVPQSDPKLRALRRRWAELLRRIYEVDPLICPRCGATMRIVACITEPRVITKILRHLAAKGADPRSPPHGGAAAA
jgi:hypothetical protein